LNEEGNAEAAAARIAAPRMALVRIFMEETWRLRGGRRVERRVEGGGARRRYWGDNKERIGATEGPNRIMFRL